MNFTLKTVQTLSAIATVAAAATVAIAPANALTLTTTSGVSSSESGVITIDFGDTVPDGSVVPATGYTSGIATYTGGGIASGSVDSQFAQPFGADGDYLTLGPGAAQPTPVTITFTSLLNYFGLYWGSVDTYNTIEFFNGATSLGLFDGLDVLNPANGSQGAGGSVYVNFFANNSSEYFNRVVLRSTEFAFESDNHAYRAIPTPALLPGLVGFGVAALRKRRAKAMSEVDA